MNRLRDQLDSRDPAVATAARLFAAAEPTHASPREMERVLAALAARRRPRPSPIRHLRPALALLVFFCLMAVAWATIGRQVADRFLAPPVERVRSRTSGQIENPAKAASPVIVPSVTERAPVPEEPPPQVSPKSPAVPERAASKRHHVTPEKTPLDDDLAPVVPARRALPNEAPILR